MHLDFDGEWYEWRLRGRHLVSDDGQRMTVERLRGLLWQDQMQLRRLGLASRRQAEERRKGQQLVKVVIVTLADYRHNGIAAA